MFGMRCHSPWHVLASRQIELSKVVLPFQASVLGQLAAVMDVLVSVGAPRAFHPALRSTSDPLLRLFERATRSVLESASGEVEAAPLDEAMFEELAGALSPGSGDPADSQVSLPGKLGLGVLASKITS